MKEQLENANQSIKGLQDYIKKKSLKDLQINQQHQDSLQKIEAKHQQKITDLTNENKDKTAIIDNLQEYIRKTHNKPQVNEAVT